MDGRLSLREILPRYHASALKSMADASGVTPPDAKKASLVEPLAAHFVDPAHVADAWAALDETARRVLERLLLAGTPVHRDALEETLLVEGVVGPEETGRRGGYGYRRRPEPGNPYDRQSVVLADVLARLEIAGLALSDTPAEGVTVVAFGRGAVYMVPGEVRPHLPVPSRADDAPEVHEVAPGDPAAFSRELFLIWSFIWTRRPTLLATSATLSKRDLTALAEQLPFDVDVKSVKREDEIPRIHVPRCMLQDLALVGEDDVLEADEVSARWFWGAPLADRIGMCLSARLEARWHNELQWLRGVEWDPGRRADRSWTPDQVLAARRRVVAHLGRLAGDGEWLAFSSLPEALRMAEPDFLLGSSGARYGGWSSGLTPSYMNRYRSYYNAQGWDFYGVTDPAEGWVHVEGAFVARLLIALSRLGLLDLGWSDTGAFKAFRLTPMGRHLLAGAEAPPESPDPGARVVLQPNFHVVAFGAVPEVTLMDLELFADRLSADRAVEFELTRDSLYRAQRAGIGADWVTARLEDLTGAPLPQNVVRTMAEWQEAHERIVVRRGVHLLQTADPALLTELVEEADSALRPLSPTCAVVRESDRLGQLLGERGIVPAREEGAGELGGAVMDEEGVVRFSQQVPGIRALGRVQVLAEWQPEAGCWRLTRASVQRARMEHALDAAAQVKAWRAVLDDPVPDWLEQRIKVWGGHYGAAKLHRSGFVELPSEEALRAVREHPELREQLRRVRPRGPLVAIEGLDLDRLADLLAEYGIDVGDG